MVTTIMVVEDEAALAGVVRDYLAREDYSVLTVDDGQAALDLARARQPDVVILDVMCRVSTVSRSAAACASSPTPMS